MKTFLKLLIVMICVNLTVFSKVEPTDTDGDGYLNISTLDHLRWVSETSDSWDKNFELDNDIDANDTRNWNIGDHDGDPATPDSAMGWSPIGNVEVSYTGVFNGNGYKIDNLFVSREKQDYVGFIGITDSARLSNLGITNCNIIGNEYVASLMAIAYIVELTNCYCSGFILGKGEHVGGLVGASSGSTINNCYNLADINCDSKTVGGLVGENRTTFINNSYNAGNVFSSNGITGGLIGSNMYSIITNCYNKGDVNSNGSWVGGLIGSNSSNLSKVRNCFNVGNVSALSIIGGLIGKHSGTIMNCFSKGIITGKEGYVAGFVGINSGEYTEIINSYSTSQVVCKEGEYGGFVAWNYLAKITNSFWNIEISGIKTSDGGFARSAFELKEISTFTDAGWDFNTIWAIDGVTNDGYPFFRDGITSVEDEVIVFDEASYSIFPNPASDYIIFKYPSESSKPSEGFEIEIYNVHGEKLISFSPALSQSERELRINVSHLPTGIYFVKLGDKVEKFVKE